MELCARFCVLFFGLILLLSSFLLFECRKLDGYNFPVYSTKQCPKNNIEWNQRFSAINCTEKNGYMCLPNENITGLLEFCHTNKFILIQEGICLYLNKRDSALYPYNCSGFLSGCPNTSYISDSLFEKPECTSIGYGCFLAEPSCQRDTDHISIESSNVGWLVGTTIGVFTIACIVTYLVINYRKRIKTCIQYNEVETPGQGVSFLSLNRHDVNELDEEVSMSTMEEGENWNKDIGSDDELQVDQAIMRQWQEDNEHFVETKASKEVERLINCQNIAVVTGHSGSGKSAIMHHIALKYRNKGWNVKPVCTVMEMIQTINSFTSVLDKKALFVLNDPIGKESFDEIEYTTLRKYEETIKACLNNVKLLMSCRKYILNDDKVKGLLKDESNIVDISNDKLKLDEKEKEEIWNKYIITENVPKEELIKIIRTEAYFPLLCKLCFSKKIKVHEMLRFFTEPVEVLEEEINNFRKSFQEKYCALVLLVLFNNDFCVEDILEPSISTEKYGLALKLCEMKKNTAPNTIDDAFETLLGFFVKKITNSYHFYHDFVMEVTTYVFGKRCPLQIIKYADIGFLRKRVKLKCLNDNRDQFTIHLGDKYIDALGKRLFNDIFGKRLLDVVLNPCLKNEKVIHIIIKELEKHPEKYKLLLKKIKLQIDNQYIDQTSNHFFSSKLAFVSLKEKISPLSAIIIFCDTRLSSYCLNALQQMPEHFIGSSLFPSVCCNGSKDVFDIFIKDQIRESLAEEWKFLFPIHIASAFNNNKILDELLQNGADVNMKTTNEHFWTPLTIATGNDTQENEEDDMKDFSNSKRNGTVQLLLSNGADINLCMENGASPLYVACQKGYNNIVQLLLSRGADINLCMKNGASPLLIACQEEHDNIVQNLLSNGANINTSMEDGTSPLSKACHEGHKTTVEILLQNGANINLCMQNGTSPLYNACQKGNGIIVELLLQKGADSNLCKENGASPLHIACEMGYDHIVKQLLSNKAKINLCMKDGASPLCIACKKGHSVIIEHLLQKGADINICKENGENPLHVACEIGHENIVQLLSSYGADINSCMKDGASPLYIASQQGHGIIVELLLQKGADINLCKENGENPLHVACEIGHENIVQLLLSNGASINSCMKYGASPLYIASQQGHGIIVELLLQKGADINLCKENGENPLHVACEIGHENIVQLLLSNGASINSCIKYGPSPLCIACGKGHGKIVDLLLQKGADINLCKENGENPLHAACEIGHEHIVQLLLSNGASINSCMKYGPSPLGIACGKGHGKIVDLLLQKGADIDLVSKNENAPLHEACENECHSIVQLLINNGANINLCSKYGVSPLYIACRDGLISIVPLLIDKGADVNMCVHRSFSPLFIACRNGEDIIVQLLLSNGADVNFCNKFGETPLYAACEYGNDGVVQLLLNNGADINQSTKEGLSPLLIACQQGHDNIVQQLLNYEANKLK